LHPPDTEEYIPNGVGFQAISAFCLHIFYTTWYSYVQEVLMEFRERLRHLRERKGLSQNALSKQSGVPQSVIQRLESGIRGVEHLSVGVAQKLARALGVSVDHLTGMYEEAA
jgi:ribosome-binding protein aMBF1 (putative translation factor)